MKNNNIKRILTVIVLILISGLVYSHNGPKEQPKIGVVLPLTGGLASIGEDLQKGMLLAAKEEGILLDVQNGEGNPQKSLSAAQAFAELNKYSVILTAFRGASISIASGLKDKNVIVFANTAVTDGKRVSPTTDNFFVFGPEVVRSAEILGQYSKAISLCKTYAALSEQSEVGQDKILGFTRGISYEPVVTEMFDPAATDFRTNILKLKAQNTECVFVEAKSNAMPILLKQFEENKFYPKVFSTTYGVTQSVLDGAPEKQLANLSVSIGTLREDNTFFAKYKTVYSNTATDWNATGYEMVKLMSAPLKKCEKDIQCIKVELNKIKNVDSAFGPVSIDAGQEIKLREYGVYKVVDKHYVKAE